MPGPPFGPSWRMTTTCPGFTLPPRMPSHASSCESKQMACPLNFIIEA